MTKLAKILIIEDEKANSDRLTRLLTKIRPSYRVLDVLPSIKKSVSWFEVNTAPDLVFMDIRLRDGISFEIFNRTDLPCPVIFTTAYDEYAVQAFKYNSIDYLLKPIELADLELALTKYERAAIPPSQQEPLLKNLLDYMDQKIYRKRFLIPYRDEYLRISTDEIAYFFSQDGVTSACLFNGKSYLIAQALDSLEQQLDPKQFFRANRQYIVSMNAVDKVHNYFNAKLKLEIRNCQEGVIVSRIKAPLLRDWLDY
ncbi:response regulator transcription factor [Sphingobacterium phlebotomi]|uniref:Response regulator transcription factor n=1 Tax=Sphingobacterium phlebotomi TaxID=2605433 RepID=A0A5D4GW36_9SPHI|nr:LytTR family DNA-binding domain-containing protein [Sphingobacterium phlebotomi]TYR32537.1 response regulator transcription factor [Sphingobacterium phlebotomi]